MHDAFGQPLTCASPEAVRHYDHAVDAHLHAWPGAMQAVDEALAAAPDFALAHALAAWLWYGQGRADLARQAAERALSEAGTTRTGECAAAWQGPIGEGIGVHRAVDSSAALPKC